MESGVRPVRRFESMAEKKGAEAGGGEEKKEKKGLLGNKLVLIGGGVAVLLIVGGGAAFFLMGGKSEEKPAEVAAQMVEAEGPAAFYYDLPIMILNLSSSDNRTTYVKLQVALEVGDEKMLKLVEPNMPRVLDAFQTYMRELRASDLQGSAGLYRLKEELQRRINIAVYPAQVDDVLFKNVIIQ